MKACSRCGVSKPLVGFYRRSSAPDGRMGVCRRCYLENIKAREARKSAMARWHWMGIYA